VVSDNGAWGTFNVPRGKEVQSDEIDARFWVKVYDAAGG
jgi:hypothetical protein